MGMEIWGREVKGVQVDGATRCVHYHFALDIVAIKFKCCGTYYPCCECHEALAGHAVQRWPEAEFGEKAILCGACGHELTIAEYMRCGSQCPKCQMPFNPGCLKHLGLYFEVD